MVFGLYISEVKVVEVDDECRGFLNGIVFDLVLFWCIIFFLENIDLFFFFDKDMLMFFWFCIFINILSFCCVSLFLNMYINGL